MASSFTKELAIYRVSVPDFGFQALYVGDMLVDIETARAAGVAVWVLPTGSDERAHLEAARPDRLLDGLGDLVFALAAGSPIL